MGSVGVYVLATFICTQLMFCVCHFSPKEHTHEDQSQSNDTTVPPISDHRFFLHEIFTKYGHDGQMTFEGFEHLLESLGLGNIIISDHDVAAHKENEFRNIHATHNHLKKGGSKPATRMEKGVTASDHEDHSHIHSPTPTTRTSPRSPSSLVRHPHHSQDNSLSTSHLDDNLSGHIHYDKDTAPNSSDTGSHQKSIYHYRLRESKIPDFLVNISIMVDQHQELVGERAPDIFIEQCLSPREILQTFGINQTSSLNPVSFLHLCPAIIYELDQGHCLFRDRIALKERSIASINQWIYSSIAVILISLCGLLSVAVIPIMQKWFYHTLLQFLIGLAIGSLTGDGLLHLMPHAMLAGEGDHNHNDPMASIAAEKMAVWRGLAALGGIFFFFIAERLLGNYAVNRKQRKELKGSKSKGLNSSHQNEVLNNVTVGEKLSQYRKSSYDFETSEKEMINMLGAETFSSRKNSVESLPEFEASCEKRRPSFTDPSPGGNCTVTVPEHRSHSHGHGHSHEVPDSVTAVAWMVIMGDGLHNFCDGLAIGAAFASGIEGGISTTVAVFCHELPHELGDFAMLLKTGMKVKQAMLYNGLSSILCFIGMIIGVSLGNVHSATSWVFAGTAGMFLYIALVDMLPELSGPSSDSGETPNYQLAVQVLGICCGITVMLLIAHYEQELQNFISS